MKKIFEAAKTRGYGFIGGIKRNGIIYPNGKKISISDFAKIIDIEEFNLVTVNSKEYYVYRYDGFLNGIDNATVLISYNKSNISKRKFVRAFISSDTELDTQTILEYYSNRWSIEVFFKQQKGYLGFGSYQMRSIKSINRLLMLTSLVYFMCLTFSFGSLF